MTRDRDWEARKESARIAMHRAAAEYDRCREERRRWNLNPFSPEYEAAARAEEEAMHRYMEARDYYMDL